MTEDHKKRPETLAAQVLHYINPASGGLIPPIETSTTFGRDEAYRLLVADNSYARDQNPTFRQVEELLARLEEGREALLFASGMAAAAAVVQALRPGDHIVAPRVMYWGLRKWMESFAGDWGLGLTLYDATNPEGLKAAIRPGKTKLVWIETPCNPTWDVIDIKAAAEMAHAAGAYLAVDSTVATPVLTQPLKLGADIVFHSATKYLNGHGDVVAGALVTSIPESELWQRVHNNRHMGGAIAGPFEAWLLLRGMRTLYLRVERASATALAIARHFHGHPKVGAVLYPGLPDHPGHEVAARQMSGGFGGMLSLRIKGGAEAALAVACGLNVFVRATSLGGTESLVEHRASIEGPSSPIPADLLRLSVGIEHEDDLIADLEAALARLP